MNQYFNPNEIKKSNIKSMSIFLHKNESKLRSDLALLGNEGFCFKYIANMNELEFYSFIGEGRKFQFLRPVINSLVDENQLKTIMINEWECTSFMLTSLQVREIIHYIKINKEKIIISKECHPPKKQKNNIRI